MDKIDAKQLKYKLFSIHKDIFKNENIDKLGTNDILLKIIEERVGEDSWEKNKEFYYMIVQSFVDIKSLATIKKKKLRNIAKKLSKDITDRYKEKKKKKKKRKSSSDESNSDS